jgi:protein involved in sex pheromone biosynthesis
MSKRLFLTLLAATLATAACSNPVDGNNEQRNRPRVSHDEAATSGGNMMGGSS